MFKGIFDGIFGQEKKLCPSCGQEFGAREASSEDDGTLCPSCLEQSALSPEAEKEMHETNEEIGQRWLDSLDE